MFSIVYIYFSKTKKRREGKRKGKRSRSGGGWEMRTHVYGIICWIFAICLKYVTYMCSINSVVFFSSMEKLIERSRYVEVLQFSVPISYVCVETHLNCEVVKACLYFCRDKTTQAEIHPARHLVVAKKTMRRGKWR